MQVLPQLIPAGLELTEPAPAPASVTVTTIRLRVKVAATDAAAFRATTQLPVPAQPAPDHPANVELADGVAVKVTVVPAAKLAAQVAPQPMPGGDEVTVPMPVPPGTTVSR
jgi:hypothetical protein